MDAIFYLAAPLGTAAITAYVTLRVARRQNSGTVDTSDADALWRASEAMRKELRDEALDLRRKAHDAEKRADEAEKRAENLQREIYFLRQEIFDLRNRMGRIEDETRKIGNGGNGGH